VSHLSDTNPEAARFLLQAQRERSPADRLRQVGALNALARRVAEASIRCEHPKWPDWDVRAEMARRLLGPELARDVMAEIARRGLPSR
jgi:hypothetical protein